MDSISRPDNPKSILQIHMASQHTRLISMYSTVVELTLLNHKIIANPKLIQHPNVLFLSTALPS